jgi:hypothetical protein
MIKYSNVDGSATPNLDFLKQSLVDIDAKIVSTNNSIPPYEYERKAWNAEALRLSNIMSTTRSGSKKYDGLYVEYQKALNRRDDYVLLIETQNNLLKTLESDRLVIVDKIAKYQDAVAQSLSQGNTDAGSQQVAEILIEQEVQTLKNQKYGYLKYGAIGLGVIVLTFVVIKVLKK